MRSSVSLPQQAVDLQYNVSSGFGFGTVFFSKRAGHRFWDITLIDAFVSVSVRSGESCALRSEVSFLDLPGASKGVLAS